MLDREHRDTDVRAAAIESLAARFQADPAQADLFDLFDPPDPTEPVDPVKAAPEAAELLTARLEAAVTALRMPYGAPHHAWFD